MSTTGSFRCRFLVAAGMVLVLAAGCNPPNPGPTPTPTPSVSGSASPSPEPSPTPSASASPSPSLSPSPSPDPLEWPTPDTTGVPAGTVLRDWTGPDSLPPGTYVGYRFPRRVSVASGGVVIRRSHLAQGINNFADGGGGRGFRIEDSTLGSPTACYPDFVLGTTDFTASRVEVYGDDGVRISERGWAPGQAQITIEDSYIRPCNSSSLSHSDGVQAYGTNGPATIRHNTIDMRGAEAYTAGVYWETAYRGATIVNNLFVGHGPEDYYGTVLSGTGGPVHVVSGNRWAGYRHPNRGDQCGHIAWGADNRMVTLDRWRVAQLGAEVTCS